MSVETLALKNANEKRGASYRQIAAQFIKDFPMGTSLTNEDFDQWAKRHGYLTVPDATSVENFSKKCDAWLAHLTRRNQLRNNIFKASTHVAMLDFGSECFVINVLKGGTMLVETPEEALQETGFATKLGTLIGNKRRQLAYLLQSVDINSLPEYQRALVENLYDELSDWNGELHLQTSNFDRRLSKLTRNIRLGVETGAIQIKNHAITALLNNETAPDDNEIPDFLS